MFIHWGASPDIELYIQETGRAGRDGLASKAILYNVRRTVNRFTDEDMREYVKNRDKCRRQLPLKDFGAVLDISNSFTCLCCDICKLICECSDCQQVRLLCIITLSFINFYYIINTLKVKN